MSGGCGGGWVRLPKPFLGRQQRISKEREKGKDKERKIKSWKACKVDGLDMIDYFSKTKEKGTKKGKLKNGLQA